MFLLRQQHLDAFATKKAGDFTGRVITHVKAVWGPECEELGEAALTEMVAGSVQRGAALGLVAEMDLVRYVDLGFLLVKDFEKHPLSLWVRPVLADPALSPVAKLDQIYKRMENEFALIEKRRGGRA